jgi:hypothetical protein
MVKGWKMLGTKNTFILYFESQSKALCCVLITDHDALFVAELIIIGLLLDLI